MPETYVSEIARGDGSSTHPDYPRWPQTIPLPPESLMKSVGGLSIESFLVVSDAWSHLVARYTKPNCRVLDIGCGCGRIARGLTNDHNIREYTGFDVVRESIEWCCNFIASDSPQFQFSHFDLQSGAYNPAGGQPACDLRFPCPDSSVGVAFAASVFTHILEADARHYLHEIRRVLVDDGIALLSIRTDTPPGVTFYGDERLVHIAADYFVDMCREAGLRERERIEDLSTQSVFILEPA